MDEIIFSVLEEITGEDLRNERDDNLFESGRLDSLGVIELIIAIECKTGLKLDPALIDRKEIETPNKIVQYLKTLKG